jgi:uncharacterized membrane protein YgdD (TMEM256/DUF423 family)
MSNRNVWLGTAAAFGGLSVALGAFGAHGLADRLGAEQLEWWHTASLYHALHALALVAWSLFRERRECGAAPGWCFALGTSIFAGALYGLALGGPSWLGAVTPIGGVLLIAGWSLFAIQALRR